MLTAHAVIPATLIGHSWGAWLSLMLTARSPHLVEKLVLVASGPFTSEYAAEIAPARDARLSPQEPRDLERIEEALQSATGTEKNGLFAEYAALSSKIDSYSPIEAPNEILSGGLDVFEAVWPEAALLRDNGHLLEMARHVVCPVIAIHGDYDPHPIAGVEKPLSSAVKDFHVVLLEKCGHTPWLERDAREAFYAVLLRELRRGRGTDEHIALTPKG